MFYLFCNVHLDDQAEPNYFTMYPTATRVCTLPAATINGSIFLQYLCLCLARDEATTLSCSELAASIC